MISVQFGASSIDRNPITSHRIAPRKISAGWVFRISSNKCFCSFRVVILVCVFPVPEPSTSSSKMPPNYGFPSTVPTHKQIRWRLRKRESINSSRNTTRSSLSIRRVAIGRRLDCWKKCKKSLLPCPPTMLFWSWTRHKDRPCTTKPRPFRTP